MLTITDLRAVAASPGRRSVNGRVARAEHVAEASRILPIKRGEKPCPGAHDTEQIRAREACPACKAVV